MVFLLLSYVFMIQPIVSGLGFLGVKDLASGTILNPPLLFTAAPSSSTVMTIIGLGLLLMASKYVDMVKDALQVPPFKYAAAIGEALQYGWNQTANENSNWRNSNVGDSVHRRLGARIATTTKGRVDLEDQYARIGGGTSPTTGKVYNSPPLPSNPPKKS